MKSQSKNNHKVLKSGYSYRTSRSRINWNAPDVKKQKHKTPNGWYMFVFLWIIWVCILLIGIFAHNKLLDHTQVLKNAFVIASVIVWALTLIWLAARSMIFSRVTYMFFKISETIKLRQLKKMLKLDNNDEIIDNVSNYDEYKTYTEIKKHNSANAFYVSIGVFSALFLITFIVALV